MKRTDIHMRDPFVLLHEGTYYLYGSTDDNTWEGPERVSIFIKARIWRTLRGLFPPSARRRISGERKISGLRKFGPIRVNFICWRLSSQKDTIEGCRCSVPTHRRVRLNL